jgi:16S rRNA (uracil1498-N3)-methyltransferase
MARRRFFVDEVRGGQARIEGDEAHHLTRVLRVESGQRYEISDNHDVYLAEIEAARKDLVTFSILDRLSSEEPLVQITLYASLVRFERLELLLEKATELGIATFIPVEAERSEKGLEQAAPKRMLRWNRIAREASEQSRRTKLPAIDPPCSFRQAVTFAPGLRLILDESPAAQPILKALPSLRSKQDMVSLLIGPEGGWTDRERAATVAEGWSPVSLGPTILKTETAAIAALAVINAAWQAGS